MTAGTVDWPVAHPRPTGPWTLRRGDRWAAFDPEGGQVEVVDPAADERLPGLGPALSAGRLIGYRVGRRAVVATESGFVKVVRPRRLDALVARHELLAGSPAAPLTPRVASVEPDGRVALTRVPGRSLHEELRVDPRRRFDDVAGPLFALHDLLPPPWLAPRAVDDPAVSVGTSRRAPTVHLPAIERAARRLPPLEPRPDVVVHGDLHDKNVFAAAGGLIDLDGIGLGAPEDDVANLAVHLELRNLQARSGLPIGARSAALVGAITARRALDRSRLRVVERHTWFRLACLYQYRAGSAALVPMLLRLAIGEPGEDDGDLCATELAGAELE